MKMGKIRTGLLRGVALLLVSAQLLPVSQNTYAEEAFAAGEEPVISEEAEPAAEPVAEVTAKPAAEPADVEMEESSEESVVEESSDDSEGVSVEADPEEDVVEAEEGSEETSEGIIQSISQEESEETAIVIAGDGTEVQTDTEGYRVESSGDQVYLFYQDQQVTETMVLIREKQYADHRVFSILDPRENVDWAETAIYSFDAMGEGTCVPTDQTGIFTITYKEAASLYYLQNGRIYQGDSQTIVYNKKTYQIAENGSAALYTGIYNGYFYESGSKLLNRNILVSDITGNKILAPSKASKYPEAVIYQTNSKGKAAVYQESGILELYYKGSVFKYYIVNGRIHTGTTARYQTCEDLLYKLDTYGRPTIYSGIYNKYVYYQGIKKTNTTAYYYFTGKYLYSVTAKGRATRITKDAVSKEYYIPAFMKDNKQYFCCMDPTSGKTAIYIKNASRSGSYYKKDSQGRLCKIIYRTGRCQIFTGVRNNKYYYNGKIKTAAKAFYALFNDYIYYVKKDGTASVYIRNASSKKTYLLSVDGYLCFVYNNTGKVKSKMTSDEARSHLVSTAMLYLGYNEADGSFKKILTTYNEYKPLPRSYAVQPWDAWCAAFTSAVFIKAGMATLAAIECSCGEQIELWKQKKCWVENDAYVPKPGDIIYFHWTSGESGDCTAWPNHVGIVTGVKNGYIQTIEGNYNEKVATRSIKVNDYRIRGFAVPKY